MDPHKRSLKPLKVINSNLRRKNLTKHMGRMQSNTIDIHITLTQNMTNNSISSNSPDLTPQSITCAKVTNPINARSCGDTYPTKVCPPHSLINREITKYMIPRLNSTSTKTHSYGRYQNTIYEDDHASI